MLILIDRYLTGGESPYELFPRTETGPDGETFCRWSPCQSSDWWNSPAKTPDEVMEAYHNRKRK